MLVFLINFYPNAPHFVKKIVFEDLFIFELNLMMQTFNPNTWEEETSMSPRPAYIVRPCLK